MAEDLIIYLPNHGYSEDDPIHISWLDGLYYVTDPDTDSFKLTTTIYGPVVEFDVTITSGYVREMTGLPITIAIQNLGHLEGEGVRVTAFGNDAGYYVVENGQIELLEAVYSYQVGKPYTAKIKTMRFSVPGTPVIRTKIKRLVELSARVVKTKDGQIGQEALGKEYIENMDADYSKVSKDYKALNKAGFDPDGYVIVKSVGPYPMTLLGIATEIET